MSSTSGPRRMRPDTATVQSIMAQDIEAYSRDGPTAGAARDPDNSSRNPDPMRPAAVPTISLQRVLLDSYEFQGLLEMFWFVLFFASIVGFVWMQWSATGAVFRSTIVESVRSWDPGTDWQSFNLADIESVEDAFDYYSGYLGSIYNKTQANNLTPEKLWIGEYAEISYVRLLANFEMSCALKSRNAGWSQPSEQNKVGVLVECYKDADESRNGDAEYNKWQNFRNSGRWRPVRDEDGNVRPGQFSTTLFSRNKTTMEGWQFKEGNYTMLDRLDDIGNLDRDVLGTYAASITMHMLGVNRIGQDAVYVYVETRISGWRNSHKLLTRMLVSTVNTLIPRGTHPTLTFWLLFTFCVVAGGLTLYLLRKEVGIARLCSLQNGSVFYYFRYRWNQLQLAGLLFAVGFLLSFFFIITQNRYSYEDLIFNMDDQEFTKLQSQADSYTLWLYFGLFLMGWEGMCMLRFMRVHRGLKIFYQVFTEAFRWLVDFFVFVMYVFLVLGLLVFGCFQISGGNPLFVEYGTGLSAMARLQFQLLDFNDFTALYLGLGRDGGWVVELLFWMTVIMLVVFVANILLAIFTGAYESARRKGLEVEDSFLGMVLKRMYFTAVKFFFDFIWFPVMHWVVVRKGNLEYHPNDVRTNVPRQGTYFEWILDDGMWRRRLKDRSWDLLQARWMLAQRPPLKAIVALYTDFATLKLIPSNAHPKWQALHRGITHHGHRPMHAGANPDRFQQAVPRMLEELTEEQLTELFNVLLEVQHELAVKNTISRVVVGGSQFHVLRQGMIDKIVKDVVRVYQFVPKPKRDLNRDGIDDDEDDPSALLKDMRNRMNQIANANRDLQAQVALVTGTLQQMMDRQGQQYRQSSRQWATDV